eukprot:4113577-Amphidinium_carterae.1
MASRMRETPEFQTSAKETCSKTTRKAQVGKQDCVYCDFKATSCAEWLATDCKKLGWMSHMRP